MEDIQFVVQVKHGMVDGVLVTHGRRGLEILLLVRELFLATGFRPVVEA